MSPNHPGGFFMLTLLLALATFQNPPIDAMITWRANKMYAFSGAYYYRYDLAQNRVDSGYPRPIAGNWPGLPFKRIDAAINWQNGKAYFFSGAQYVRYDINSDRVDGVPTSIRQGWRIPWDRVDAAIYWGEGKAYLFNMAQRTYIRYSLGASQPDPGYPRDINAAWSGWPLPRIDAGTNYGGRVYMAKGGEFARWMLSPQRAEMGFPRGTAFLPDVAPNNVIRPPTQTPPPVANTGYCKINGTLVQIVRNQYNQTMYQRWDNARVDLHQANAYLRPRYDQLIRAGYNHAQAMGQIVKEDNLWSFAVNTSTVPGKQKTQKYNYIYSWFGFINLQPGFYRVVVPGYPRLTRWITFSAGGQEYNLALEYP